MVVWLMIASVLALGEESSPSDPEIVATHCVYETPIPKHHLSRCWRSYADYQASPELPETTTWLDLDSGSDRDETFGRCGPFVQVKEVRFDSSPRIVSHETRAEAHARLIREELDHLRRTGRPKCFPSATRKTEFTEARSPEAVARVRRIEEESRSSIQSTRAPDSLTLLALADASLTPPDPVVCSLDLCLAIDNSGSMTDDVQFVGKELARLIPAWNARYPCGVRVSIHRFGQDNSLAYHFDRARSITSDLGAITEFLTTFQARGGGIEPLNDAVDACMGDLPNDPSSHRSVVVFTDERGDLVNCSPSMAAVLARARAAGAEVHLIDHIEDSGSKRPANSGDSQVEVSADGRVAATYSWASTEHLGERMVRVRFWDLATRELLSQCDVEKKNVLDVRLSPDGKRLYVPDFANDLLRVVDTQNGTTLTEARIPVNRWTSRLAPSWDGTRVAIVRAWRGDVEIYDSRTGVPKKRIPWPGTLDQLVMSPDGASIWACRDGELGELRSATNGAILLTAKCHSDGRAPEFARDGTTMFVDSGSSLQTFDLRSRKRARETPYEPHPYASLQTSADGRVGLLGPVRRPSVYRLIDFEVGTAREVDIGSVYQARLTPDGQTILATRVFGTPVQIDIKSLQPIGSLDVPPVERVCHESFHPTTGHSASAECPSFRIHPLSIARRDCAGGFVSEGPGSYLGRSGALIPSSVGTEKAEE